MGLAGLAAFVLVMANSLTASGLELCLENAARLDDAAVRTFRAELSALLGASGRPAIFSQCHPGTVSITLLRQPPGEEPSALGGTRHRNGRLLPEIDLFVGPVTRIVGTNLPAVVGRALARVATHELGHWLSQGMGHTERGVMMERLSAAHLMAREHIFFRVPPGD